MIKTLALYTIAICSSCNSSPELQQEVVSLERQRDSLIYISEQEVEPEPSLFHYVREREQRDSTHLLFAYPALREYTFFNFFPGASLQDTLFQATDVHKDTL